MVVAVSTTVAISAREGGGTLVRPNGPARVPGPRPLSPVQPPHQPVSSRASRHTASESLAGGQRAHHDHHAAAQGGTAARRRRGTKSPAHEVPRPAGDIAAPAVDLDGGPCAQLLPGYHGRRLRCRPRNRACPGVPTGPTGAGQPVQDLVRPAGLPWVHTSGTWSSVGWGARHLHRGRLRRRLGAACSQKWGVLY
jgi:hypothetical protein